MKTIKYAIIGSSNCGKTSLLTRFLYPLSYLSNFCQPTILNHQFFNYNQGEYKLDIWDTSGKSNFAFLRTSAYANADVLLLCFDLNNKQSFQDLEQIWLPEIFATLHLPNLILVGCKSDLILDVAQCHIDFLVKKFNIKHYFATSSFLNLNVENVFISPLDEYKITINIPEVQKPKRRKFKFLCC